MPGKRKESKLEASYYAKRPRLDIRALLGCRSVASPQASTPPFSVGSAPVEVRLAWAGGGGSGSGRAVVSWQVADDASGSGFGASSAGWLGPGVSCAVGGHPSAPSSSSSTSFVGAIAWSSACSSSAAAAPTGAAGMAMPHSAHPDPLFATAGAMSVTHLGQRYDRMQSRAPAAASSFRHPSGQHRPDQIGMVPGAGQGPFPPPTAASSTALAATTHGVGMPAPTQHATATSATASSTSLVRVVPASRRSAPNGLARSGAASAGALVAMAPMGSVPTMGSTSMQVSVQGAIVAAAAPTGPASAASTRTVGAGGSRRAFGGLEVGPQAPLPLPLLWAMCIRRSSRKPEPAQQGPNAQTFAEEGPQSEGPGRSLNEMQLAAATGAIDAPLVIVAGAGTGKTTTLLGRVGHLVRSGANPRHILLLTFTNNSADDIANRLAGSLGREVAQHVTCTTIHAFCLALIRCFGGKLGFDTKIKVAEKGALRTILSEAWQWSALEPERKLCAKWLALDILGPRGWNIIFQTFRGQDLQGFRECILSPLPEETPGNSNRAPAKNPKVVESLISLDALRAALTSSPPALQMGAFQYGYFFIGFHEPGDDTRNWWAAPKAFTLQRGVRVPKGAVLRWAEHVQPSGQASGLDAGADMPQILQSLLSQAPWAQVRVRFEVATAPPKGSPAALRVKEDSRWRAWLARAVFLHLQKGHDPQREASPLAASLPALVPKKGRGAEKLLTILPKKGQVPDLAKRITMAKRDRKSPGEFMATDAPGDLAYCWTFCQEHMRHRGLVDFNDMLIMAGRLLQLPEVCSIVRAQQRHILVDEFQDVSTPQFEVLKPLIDNSPGRSLCVVGDDDQTIYTWNGSTTQIFTMLREHCGRNSRLVQLTQNYRSSESILRVGHMALTQNARRIPKELRACAVWAVDEAQCPPPLLWECGTPDDEARAIADEIEVLLGRSQACSQALDHLGAALAAAPCQHPREIAVLFRCFNFKRKVHHPLTHELAQRRIPYYVVREAPFWEQGFALDLLAYLRLVAGASPDDDGAFLRAIAHPPRGCGKGLVDRLRERQELAVEASSGGMQRRPSLEMVARQAMQLQPGTSARGVGESSFPLPRRAAAGLKAFLEILMELRVQCATLPVDQALELIATKSGYCEWYETERKKKKRKANGPVADGDADDDEDDSDEDEEAEGAEEPRRGHEAKKKEEDDAADSASASEVEGSDDEEENMEVERPAPGQVDESTAAPGGAASSTPREVDHELMQIVPWEPVQDALGGRASSSSGGPQKTKVPGKIAEAVEMAKYFADRWESPFQSSAQEEQSAPSNVPALFALCGKRLMAQAARSEAMRTELAMELPETVLDRLAGECGRCGRLQFEDFAAKVALDPKDTTTGAMQQGRKGRRGSRASGPARGVCITTIHAAKGLEWPAVFVAHWNDGFLPMAPAKVEVLDASGKKVKRDPTPAEAEEHQEEERRLAHVAVTRAQKRLVITHLRSWSSKYGGELAGLSSLPLPLPLLPEGEPNAAMWVRAMPKSALELEWDAQEGSPSSS
mmetsp:Transcript_46957/g.149799  ORF Transcript_46957/g.149799 Transcript_46957/m.149799 type:complete len:1540 (+) Transcript_46957:62-4681(+)